MSVTEFAWPEMGSIAGRHCCIRFDSHSRAGADNNGDGSWRRRQRVVRFDRCVLESGRHSWLPSNAAACNKTVRRMAGSPISASVSKRGRKTWSVRTKLRFSHGSNGTARQGKAWTVPRLAIDWMLIDLDRSQQGRSHWAALTAWGRCELAWLLGEYY